VLKIKNIVSITLLVAVMLFSVQAHSRLVIEDATIRILPPGINNTAVYLSIKNTGSQAVYLTDVKTNIARTAELHAHIMDGDVMRMEQQSEIVIPAGETVLFQPGGYHIMVFGLHQALQVGQQVKVTFITGLGQEIDFTANGALPGDEKVGGHQHH
jgi:copper(I)-binding protein